MVKGLEAFREHFSTRTDNYILIGGAACGLLFDDAGLEFRATKDLDIVLCIEALNTDFGHALWAFIQAGGYQIQQSATGANRYYRFTRPTNEEYPFMLELFARKPDVLELADGAHLTPVPVDDDVASLSAILLNDDYYACIRESKRIVDRISVAGVEAIIVLKARAWLELTARKQAGDPVDGKTITKHRNDVFRLSRLLDPASTTTFTPTIGQDIHVFLDAMETEVIDFNSLGLGNRSKDTILAELRKFYSGTWRSGVRPA